MQTAQNIFVSKNNWIYTQETNNEEWALTESKYAELGLNKRI
jgi:hypothetical protein